MNTESELKLNCFQISFKELIQKRKAFLASIMSLTLDKLTY